MIIINMLCLTNLYFQERYILCVISALLTCQILPAAVSILLLSQDKWSSTYSPTSTDDTLVAYFATHPSHMKLFLLHPGNTL